MGNETTLADLRARGLDYADMTGSSFPVTDRVTDYANDGLSKLHNLLVSQEYFREVESYTLVAGTESYVLPSSFYKAQRVWRVSSGRRYMVDRFNLSQIDGYKTTGPASGDSVELWYAPQLRRLTEETDKVSVALPNGWEDYVALHIAVRLLLREESDAKPLASERQMALQDVLAHCEPRDEGMQDEIEDVYGRWNRGVWDDQGRTLRYRVMGNKIHFVEFDYLGG